MSTDKLKALDSMLAEILSEPPLISTNIRLAPPTFFDEEPAPPIPSNPPDNVEPPTDTVAAKALDSVLAEILRDPPLISTETDPAPPAFFDETPGPSIVSNPPNKLESATETTAVEPLTDADGAVRRAQQAKSLLAGLDLDTAIRLRWVMRDIRGKRTKLSPVSENDLAALIDLGFVEMREGIPRLTGMGFLVLD